MSSAQRITSKSEGTIVTVAPYQEAVIAVLPSIASNLIPMVLGGVAVAILIQHAAALPLFGVAIVTALVFGVQWGVNIAAKRYTTSD